MNASRLETDLRSAEQGAWVLGMVGELTEDAENGLLDAFTRAASQGARALVLDLTRLHGMDVGGAAVLVKLHAWCDRRGQRLLACGASPSLRQAFRLARLIEAIHVHGSLPDAVAEVVEGAAPPPPPDDGESPQGWAPASPGRLQPPPVPPGAIGLDGDDLSPVGPLQGFGPLWEKTHSIRLAGAVATPGEVIRIWREEFGNFWPRGNHAYPSERGLVPGEVALLNLSLPGGLPIATGVFILYSDETSFTFMTLEGHIQAGWITFRALEKDGVPVAHVRSLARSGDPLYEAGLVVAGHRQQDEFWHRTLENLAARFGVEGLARTHSTCVDPRSQWSRAGHARHNAGVRTALYAATGLLGRVLRFPGN